MRSFKDSVGRLWPVEINVAAIKRVRGLLGVDLIKLFDDEMKPLAELVNDPVRLVDVLYCLCKPEADARGISDEDFGRALAGDVITQAVDAFVEELIDFFPDARRRNLLRKAIEAGRQANEVLMTHAESLIDRIDWQAEVKKFIDSYTNSPGSSASTPGRLNLPNS